MTYMNTNLETAFLKCKQQIYELKEQNDLQAEAMIAITKENKRLREAMPRWR